MTTPELSEASTTSSAKRLWRNPNEFSYYIEGLAVEQGVGCYEAIMMYCEMLDVDPESVAPLVNRQLKDKLAVEFADMGLLKKQPTLYD